MHDARIAGRRLRVRAGELPLRCRSTAGDRPAARGAALARAGCWARSGDPHVAQRAAPSSCSATEPAERGRRAGASDGSTRRTPPGSPRARSSCTGVLDVAAPRSPCSTTLDRAGRGPARGRRRRARPAGEVLPAPGPPGLEAAARPDGGRDRGELTRTSALHDVRKAARRLRYAAETLAPVWGDEARELARAARALSEHLGDRQDLLLVRADLAAMADAAEAAGEPSRTWGALTGPRRRAPPAAGPRPRRSGGRTPCRCGGAAGRETSAGLRDARHVEVGDPQRRRRGAREVVVAPLPAEARHGRRWRR